MVLDSANYLNTIDLTYHNLYVVNVNLLVDGSKEHNEHSDILGKLTVSASEIISNLSIYNFYSTIDVDSLSFLVKTSADNNSRSFGLNALETITTATQKGVYRYYTFSNIDGQNKSNIYYTNINQNLEINVDYTSVKYTISFGIAEYMIDGNMNPVLVEMDVEAPASISLKRGSSLFSGTTTPAQDLGEVDDFYLNVSTMEVFVKEASGWVEHGQNEDIAVLGYKFIGYASSLTSSVEVTYSYQVDSIEPQGTNVWLCLKKEEYSIGIENYNQVVIGSNKALTSVTITKVNAAGQTSEMLTSIGTNPTLVGNSVTLTNIKASLGERILITYEVNNGFNVQYSLLSPVQIQEMLDEGKTEEELSQYYLTAFDITESIIENYISGSKLTIYFYEEKIEYSLTYCIDVNTDDGQYVMAEIDVADYEDEQNNENFQIVKFDLNGVEISAANSNLDAAVSKIVISGLYLNDTVTLKSLGNPYNEDYYVFNWFIDGRSTLSFVKDGSNYNHTESVVKTRTIQVVYSVPVAQVLISLEQDFEDNEAFTYSIVVKVDDAEVSPIEGQTNVFSIGVGKVTSITVGGLSYGYNFVGYQVNDKPLERVNGNTFEHTTVLGSNTIILKFERTLSNSILLNMMLLLAIKNWMVIMLNLME